MAETIAGAELYDRCRSSSEAERRAALEELGRLLYRVLRPRVADDPRREHLAADCAQEALVAIWSKLEADAGPDDAGSFVAWSVRIALHRLVDAQRRLEPTSVSRPTRRVALSRQARLDAPRDDAEASRLERLADPDAAEAEAHLESIELREMLAAIGASGSISEASRTVLLRGYLEDWTDNELAELLGTTRANVHVIRCRDLARLRRDEALMARLRAHRW